MVWPLRSRRSNGMIGGRAGWAADILSAGVKGSNLGSLRFFCSMPAGRGKSRAH
jgi:hypothetical protein